MKSDLAIQITPCVLTSLEKIHILKRSAPVRLRGALLDQVDQVDVVAVIRPIIITPEIIEQHMATLPSSLFTLLAGLLLPPPHCWSGRWRGLGAEVDASDHGSIYRRPEARPVLADEPRASVGIAD